MRLLKPQVSTALGWLSLVALVVLALFGLWGAPPDKVQSDAQRLMYLHVPTAWIAYLAFGVTALASALWLWKRTRAPVWSPWRSQRRCTQSWRASCPRSPGCLCRDRRGSTPRQGLSGSRLDWQATTRC